MPRYIRIIFLTLVFMLSIHIMVDKYFFLIEMVNVFLVFFTVFSLGVELNAFIKNEPDNKC